MHFKSIKINCFGTLRHWQAEDLSAGLNVILGPNEGGKSTLFHFLITLLYGFSPASLEQHPYVPWNSSGRPRGEGEIVLRNGDCFQVFRQLTSSPQGWLSRGEGKEKLHNRALPWLTGISRELYHEVYALTLDKMKFFESSSWEEIQERLLGSLGASFLHPANQVVAALEEEAKNLWRDDRRGKPRYKKLRQELKSWRQEMEKLKEGEKKKKDKDAYLKDLQLKREQLKEHQLELKAKLRKAQRLNPLRKQLARLSFLKERASLLQIPLGFPSSPLSVREQLAEKIAEREKQIGETEQKMEIAREKVQLFGEKEQSLLEREKQIALLEDQKAVELARRDKIAGLEKELQQEEKRGGLLASELLLLSFKQAETKLLLLPRAELKKRMEQWLLERDNYIKARARERAWPGFLQEEGGYRATKIVSPAWVAVLLLLGGLSLGGAYLFAWWLLVPGAVFLTLAAAYFAFRAMVAWEKKNAHKLASEEKKRMEKELEKLKERMLQKKEYFLQALQDLPLARAYLEEPGELLLAELFKLQDIARRLMDIRQEIKQLREESSRFEEEVKKAALELGFEAAPDPLETVFSLKKSLEKAAEKQWHCRQGQKELEELERALHKLKAEKQTMEKNLLYINNTFSAWGEGDVEKGIELYLNQEKARQGAEELQKHLEREYPDLDLLAGEIKETSSSADSWLFSDGELAKAEVELQELEEKLRQLAEEEAALRRELEILESSISPSELVGKGEMLEEQMKEAVYSRDKLALAASIIREADRSYRQEHQPDVLLRCRHYLEIISRGRYTALYLEEEKGQLLVEERDNPFPVPVKHPLSRGTLDQIYLALRLALVDHLDQHQEPLPLFLDEVLVNWDEKRLGRGLDLLEDISRRRQVFFFTCHHQLASLVASKAAAQLITMA